MYRCFLYKKHKRFIARIFVILFILIALLSISTILTGCGTEPITSGEIYGKEYIPARDWSERVQHVRSVKPIMFYYTTEHRHTPQKWVLHLRQYDANEHRWIYAAFEVSEEVYNKYDFYDTYEVSYEK